MEMITRNYQGDFVSVWCFDCANRKNAEPKFLICLCTPGQPKELNIEMAKSEIEIKLTDEQVKQINNFIEVSDDEPNFKDKSTGPRAKGKKKVPNL